MCGSVVQNLCSCNRTGSAVFKRLGSCSRLKIARIIILRRGGWLVKYCSKVKHPIPLSDTPYSILLVIGATLLACYPYIMVFDGFLCHLFSSRTRHNGQVFFSLLDLTIVQNPHAYSANHENHYVLEHARGTSHCALKRCL
jgi:hypothetical protein